MIVTVTCNPAWDKTAQVSRLRPGGLNRLEEVRRDLGGKGINAARIIRLLGGQAAATGFLDAEGICELERTEPEILCRFVCIKDRIRTNLKVISREDGSLTELNEPGTGVDEADWDALSLKIRELSEKDRFFCLSGSLPPSAERADRKGERSLPPAAERADRKGEGSLPSAANEKDLQENRYRKLIRQIHSSGGRVLLDASGPALAGAVEAGPDLMKPNRGELAELFQVTEENLMENLPIFIGSLFEKGVGMVLLSEGAEGSTLFMKDAFYHACGLKVEAKSTVGAGDTMAAAFLTALEKDGDPVRALACAAAASAAACTTPGTLPPSRELIRRLGREIIIKKGGTL